MAHNLTKWIKFYLIFVITTSQVSINGQQQIPCLFFLGDSSFDNGNNNLLHTMAKANYLPYGIDYPDGPTGRFSNGKNIADFLAELLGFDNPIPPHATAEGSMILKGVNYASGGIGILDNTSKQQGDQINMNQQLINHNATLTRISLLLGNQTVATDYVRQCLYIVYVGSNDYVNNYLMPQYYSSSLLYTPDQFAAILVQEYSRQLTTLYNSGARKIVIFGLGEIGCAPQELELFRANTTICVDFINNDVELFNYKLKLMVQNFNRDLPNARFIYINMIGISLGGLADPGIRVFNASCCIVSTTYAKGQCAPGQVPCTNRYEYIFYDNFHQMEHLNLLTAKRAYNAFLPSDAYPVDIRRLVQE